MRVGTIASNSRCCHLCICMYVCINCVCFNFLNESYKTMDMLISEYIYCGRVKSEEGMKVKYYSNTGLGEKML